MSEAKTRLQRVAEAIDSLTYSEMMQMADGIYELGEDKESWPNFPQDSYQVAAVLQCWADSQESEQ